MRPCDLTLLVDGPSDRSLVPIVEWIIRQQFPNLPFRVNLAASREVRLRAGLEARAQHAIRLYPCHVLLVHRDAEARDIAERAAEVQAATVALQQHVVPLVPVRMTEAWLLSDERAIRTAANNPNGAVDLKLPPAREWERLLDPKSTLTQALKSATELGAGRLRRFDVRAARQRVSDLIADFSPLRALNAFRTFEAELSAAITAYVLAQ